jgi:hypothetical protein
MKFKLVEVLSRSGNWMVDAPEEKGGDMDWGAHKEEMAEGCPYRKFYKRPNLPNSSGDYWCVYYHSKKQNTTDQDIDNALENDDNEEITVCPDDVDECPIERWKESDAWTKDDWKSHYEEEKRE